MDRTPTDLTINPRDRRFGRGMTPKRWWLNDDPIATALYNAMSAVFPKGEAFFVDSVRAFREGTPPKLHAEIAAFTKQEVLHTREHAAFNRVLERAGYDVKPLEDRVDQRVAFSRGKSPFVCLAATMALEHFTAMLAHEMLSDERHLKGADPELAAMWRWHVGEEIEHKGVAYDTWLHATRDWSRGKRWKIKSIVMVMATRNFFVDRMEGAVELLRQDGITGWRAKARLMWFAFGYPGMMRKILLALVAYALPGFHPWNHDDRALIEVADRAYAEHQAVAVAA